MFSRAAHNNSEVLITIKLPGNYESFVLFCCFFFTQFRTQTLKFIFYSEEARSFLCFCHTWDSDLVFEMCHSMFEVLQ